MSSSPFQEVKIISKKSRQIINKICPLFILFILATLLNSCEKEEPVKTPVVTTAEVSDITGISAVVGGEVIDDSGYEVTEYGVYWGTHHRPRMSGNKLELGSGTGKFNDTLTGLSENTYYYIKAYATNERGTSYGDKKRFITSPTYATVKTLPALYITSNSAYVRGSVTDDGGTDVKERGIYWSTEPEAEKTGEKFTIGSGEGDFADTLDGLSYQTEYYIKAFATNEKGTAYGDERSFTALDMPIVKTTPPEDVTSSSAILGGDITDEGSSQVISYGIYLSTSPDAEETGQKREMGHGTGEFSSKITDITDNTTYFVKAYATNQEGTSYGAEYEFETWALESSVRDIGGNKYKTKVIGEQKWMAENLATTRFRDGSSIEYVGEEDDQWRTTSQPYYGVYEDEGDNQSTYGFLYNWYVIEDERCVCPEGWKVPSEEDWQELERYLGMDDYEIERTELRGSDHGGKLKATGTVRDQTGFWRSPNTLATNETGFTALPGGFRDQRGYSEQLHYIGNWWSSTTAEADSAWIRYLFHDSGQIGRFYFPKNMGLSIRCIKKK